MTHACVGPELDISRKRSLSQEASIVSGTMYIHDAVLRTSSMVGSRLCGSTCEIGRVDNQLYHNQDQYSLSANAPPLI